MNRNNIRNRVLAAVLCAAALFGILASGLAGLAYGEPQEASITLKLGDASTGDHKELADDMKAIIGSRLKGTLYQVASMDGNGKYALADGFKDVAGLAGIPSVSGSTKASDWEAFAKAAKSEVSRGTVKGTAVEADVYQLEAGYEISKLTPGLYLLDMDRFKAADHAYEFTPYLIAAPGYGPDGGWAYGVTAGLKPERTDLCGKLVIRKTLPECRQDGDGSTFVFEVIAKRGTETVFDDVYSMVFSEHGTKELVIENLPADAEITVKEIYAGSCYKADQDVIYTRVPAEGQAVAEFRNTYEPDAPRNGASAVNHFTAGSDGKLTWTKQAESPSVNNR